MFTLKQLMLVIKESLKLLNPFGFGLKEQVMFLVRQALKIHRAVIILNPIEVVNYPTFRQRFAMSLFPNKDMLKNIAFSASGVIWHPYLNIAVTFNSSTLPIITESGTPSFLLTFSALISSEITRFTTVPTRVPMFQSPLLLAFCAHTLYYTILSSNSQAEVLR